MKLSVAVLSTLAVAVSAAGSGNLEKYLDKSNGSNNKYNIGNCSSTSDLSSSGDKYKVEITSGTDGGASGALCKKLGFDDCKPATQFVASMVFLGWSMAYGKIPDSPEDLAKSGEGSIDIGSGIETDYDVVNGTNSAVGAEFIYGPVMPLPKVSEVVDHADSYSDLNDYVDELKGGKVDGFGIPSVIVHYVSFKNSTDVQLSTIPDKDNTRAGVKLSFRRTKNETILDLSDLGYSSYSTDDAKEFSVTLSDAATAWAELWVKGAGKDLSKMYGTFSYMDYGVKMAIEPISEGFDTKHTGMSCTQGTSAALSDSEKSDTSGASSLRTPAVSAVLAMVAAALL